MLKCPNCNSNLEQQTEITGYHYWLCPNGECPSSYNHYPQRRTTQRASDKCPGCGGSGFMVKIDNRKVSCSYCDGTGICA